MSFHFNRSSKEPMSEINVTPFVDVMLVLLIIFMVTAPLLTVGVQVDLPESAADSLPDEQEPLTVSINSKGEVFIQEHPVGFEKMIPKYINDVLDRGYDVFRNNPITIADNIRPTNTLIKEAVKEALQSAKLI